VRAAFAAALLSMLLSAPALAQIGPNGAKAYDMARAADDAAGAAEDEGRETLDQIRQLPSSGRDADALKALTEQAEAAAEALAGYRKQARASADDTITTLAELSRGPRPEPARREQVEQRALLSAYEAAVMSARARSQAERIRALHAEARALLAGASASRPAPGGRSTAAPSAPRAAPGEAVVPNVVGARLEAATRDLTDAGLRLGPTTGPRDGFVVKQSPAAGSLVPRQAPVTLTLSGTAAGVTVPALPR
jgi:hypothetical protein